MNFSNKWLSVPLCIITLNLFVVLKTIDVFAQVESDQVYSYCPVLLSTILVKDLESMRFFLQYGSDPNASLENCQFEVEYVEVYGTSYTRLTVTFNGKEKEVYYGRCLCIPDPSDSSLLQILAILYEDRPSLVYTEMFYLLFNYGARAKLNSTDAEGQTPRDILRNYRNYTCSGCISDL